jgi:hypothetical protein
VKHKLYPQRPRSGLTRAIIWSGADATAAEHNIVSGKTARQDGDDVVQVVGNEFGPAELHATLGKKLDQLGKMFVLTPSGKDFVADDD